MSASTSAAAGPATANQRGLQALRSVTTWLEKHPWIIALSVATFVTAKVLRVAHGDVWTAQLILRNNGLAGLTSLVLLVAFPTAILMAFISTLLSLGAIVEAKAWVKLWAALPVLVVTGAIALFIVPWLQLKVFSAIGVLLAVGMGLWLRHSPLQDPIGTYGWPEFVWLAAVGGVVGLGGTLFSGAMWTPAERITVDDAPAPIVGYVLSIDDDRVVILRESDRGTVSYTADEIVTRERCQLSDDLGPLFRTVEYVRC